MLEERTSVKFARQCEVGQIPNAEGVPVLELPLANELRVDARAGDGGLELQIVCSRQSGHSKSGGVCMHAHVWGGVGRGGEGVGGGLGWVGGGSGA